MKITVEDRRSVSAEVTVERVEAYLERAGWTLEPGGSGSWPVWVHAAEDRKDLVLRRDFSDEVLAWAVEVIADAEQRQPSEVLSDIVGYTVGLDRATASVRRNSAMARAVDAREALARVSPRNATEHERARVRLAQAEGEVERATRALEAAIAAGKAP